MAFTAPLHTAPQGSSSRGRAFAPRLGYLAGLLVAATLVLAPPVGLAAVEFQAFQGITGAELQQKVDHYGPLGYRIISLSMYGTPASSLYAVVLVKRAGPAWISFHDLLVTEYEEGGPPPRAPFEACGPDRTTDALDCVDPACP